MLAKTRRLAAILGLATLAAACTESRLRDQPDFGNATRANRATQIADPDAHYVGVPAPGGNGIRTDMAQTRYVTHNVIEPVGISTSTVGGGGGGGGGGGSGGGGGGGGAGMAGVAAAP